MANKINEIKNLIKKECIKNNKLWFYEIHLLQVEKLAKFLLKKLPKANKEIALLSVWLHDTQRVKNLKGDHEKIGAKEAEKIMIAFGYNREIIKEVKEIILHHSGDDPKKVKNLEAKILVSADGMSHYYNDFFLQIGVLGERSISEYKAWVMEKLNRNYNKKIFFPFAKKIIKKRHDTLKYLFTMN